MHGEVNAKKPMFLPKTAILRAPLQKSEKTSPKQAFQAKRRKIDTLNTSI
jgi:hypothetical protein